MSQFSIAIPTRNRPQVLRVLLGSILSQTVAPKEVIVVDDSDNEATENLTAEMQKDFESRGVPLKYMRGGGESVTQARNMGIDASSGEICCSIDDDVVLHRDYIEEILGVYRSHPEALGVAGHIENLQLSGLSNGLNRAFSFFFTAQDRCRVRPTGTCYPAPLTRVINCEWFSGTNLSFKRQILEKFRWDEKLKKYSLCDDMDISYRIQKQKPKTLFMTPNAKVVHTYSKLARIPSDQRIQMEISYHAYFYFKNMKQTVVNTLRFMYGIFLGRLVLCIVSRNPQSVIFTIKAQLCLIRNMERVKHGKLG